MKASTTLDEASAYKGKSLLIGHSYVLRVLSPDPDNPTFKATYHTSHLWNQLCRFTNTPLGMICLLCNGKPQKNHGAAHYSNTLIWAKDIVDNRKALVEADRNGFGDATTRDFELLCDALERQLNPEPRQAE